jgi:hypothetical protein
MTTKAIPADLRIKFELTMKKLDPKRTGPHVTAEELFLKSPIIHSPAFAGKPVLDAAKKFLHDYYAKPAVKKNHNITG